MKIVYQQINFRPATLATIELAGAIIVEYRAQGYDLTLRQLYYQMVARDLIENSQRSYKKLGGIIANARLAGLVDWDAIVDRTRNLQRNPHWASPKGIVEAAVASYRIDKWQSQDYRPEIWIEKDALTGVIAPVCRELDVPYFSCRGYTSASEMWKAGRRMAYHALNGQEPVVFHLGDHDPSGIDMTRDIRERLSLFSERDIEVDRIALNMDQVESYGPPPNPAKITDSRSDGYIAEYGNESWELDALEPAVLSQLIQHAVFGVRNVDFWKEAVEDEAAGKAALQVAAQGLDL
jgi:hypothetical protein